MKETNMSHSREVGKFKFDSEGNTGIGKIEKIEKEKIEIEMETIDIEEIREVAEKLGANEKDLKKLFIALGIPPVEAQFIIGKLGTPIDE